MEAFKNLLLEIIKKKKNKPKQPTKTHKKAPEQNKYKKSLTKQAKKEN